MTRATKIEPNSWYTMQDIVREKMFSWGTSFWSARKVVAQDKKSKNILKASVTGSGRGTKYHIKGENIIKFIKLFEAGEAGL